MKKFLVMGAVALAVLNSGWLLEGGDNNCAALERLAMRKAMEHDPAMKDNKLGLAVAAGFMGLSNGRMAEQAAAVRFPGVPATGACMLGYWVGRFGGMDPAK